MLLFQKLLIETEKKLSEGQPVKQSKRIIIQEVQEDDHIKDEDTTEAGLYTVIIHVCIHVIYIIYIA